MPLSRCLLRLLSLPRAASIGRSGVRSPMYRNALILTLCLLPLRALLAQGPVPDWCRALPRPEYKTVERVSISDPWFEVYKPAQGVFAIYEPHQAEETISYLMVGEKLDLLFDSGMGIGDLKKVIAQLTKLQIILLNSHTHNDHVGDNWEFSRIYGMDTDFTRQNAQGSRLDAQAEIAPDQICGVLPKGFDSKGYATRPWKITAYTHDGDRFDLGGRTLEVIATPGHTPDAISLLDRAHGLLFTGDTYYPAPIWLFRPETDLDAYDLSIRRLAALAPQVRVVMGAHNIPVASPTQLPKLVAAFDAVRAGKVQPLPDSPGKVVYKVGDISFLMRAPTAH